MAVLTASVAKKIQTLFGVKLDNYKKAGDPHPEVAAQFAVDGILHMYKGDKYIDQLLGEEIEDAIRAGNQISKE